jgi:glycosyltransferase involved in cell wall biosynthesis
MRDSRCLPSAGVKKDKKYRVVQVTCQSPDRRSGGGLGVFQSSASLQDNQVSYFGPSFDDSMLDGFFENVHLLHASENKILKAAHYVVSGSWFNGWGALPDFARSIDSECMYLDFTKDTSAAHILRELDIPVVVRAHNVEVDYARSVYENRRSAQTAAPLLHIRNTEREILSRANAIICITEHDKDRFLELYGNEVDDLRDKLVINPVCLPEKPRNLLTPSTLGEVPTLLITGSLWFGPNAEGVIWFIKNVWPLLGTKLHLIVAGSRPSRDVRDVCSGNERIKLVASPESMDPLFKQADVFIAPIFEGGGMKVKVAEALSYGMPVVGTPHALVGYVQDAACLRCAATAEDMARGILQMLGGDYSALCRNAFKIFEQHYSMASSQLRVQRIIEDVCRGC